MTFHCVFLFPFLFMVVSLSFNCKTISLSPLSLSEYLVLHNKMCKNVKTWKLIKQIKNSGYNHKDYN